MSCKGERQKGKGKRSPSPISESVPFLFEDEDDDQDEMGRSVTATCHQPLERETEPKEIESEQG